MAFVAHVNKASRKGGQTRQGNKIIALGDLYRHNQRVGAYGKAENIDRSKTKDNYTLDSYDNNVSYEKRLDEIKGRYGITAKERAAAVASLVISASPEEMAGMSADEQRKFFEDVRDKLSEHFGKDALVYANVHNDEKTPHMHIGYVPLYRNEAGKYAIRWGDIKTDRETGKKIYRGPVHRDFLKYMQNELPQELIEKGYQIEIGGKTSTKHTETAEWREVAKERERLQEAYARKVRTVEEQEKKNEARKQELVRRREQVKEDRLLYIERNRQMDDKTKELNEREKLILAKEKRVNKALEVLGSSLGLSKADQQKVIGAENTQEVREIVVKGMNSTYKINKAAEIGATIERAKEWGESMPLIQWLSDNVAKLTPMHVDVLGLGVRVRYKKNLEEGLMQYKRDNLHDAVMNATAKDAEEAFNNDFVEPLDPTELAVVRTKVREKREERERERAKNKPSELLRPKKREKKQEKSQELGRSR